MNRLILILGLALSLPHFLLAQMGFNSPAGVTPTQDFEVYSRNGFLVSQKYKYVNANPSASINNLSCISPAPNLTALAGILKDPAGDASYTAGVSYSCTQTLGLFGPVSGTDVIGIELVFEDLDTEPAADFVIIRDFNNLERSYSGSAVPPRIIVPYPSVMIRFITDGDAAVGRGFRLRWRVLLAEPVSEPSLAGTGTSMHFNLNTGGFQAGIENFITGRSASALGGSHTVIGNYASALGGGNTASALGASAIGFTNRATGPIASALGGYNLASGASSLAIGHLNTASGNNSSALGNYMNTNNQSGTFMIGDSDPLSQGITPAGFQDQFIARFLNGYYLLTSGNNNPGGGTFGTVRTGVRLDRGQNSWASISDSTKKERFQSVNHADLLRKINAMPLSTWNYKGQHAIRHWGPMAQDFYAAFGHDGLGQVGCDTLIYSHDFAGVTFAGVQALIRENETLKARVQALEADKQRTDARLEILERAWLRGQTKRTAARRKL